MPYHRILVPTLLLAAGLSAADTDKAELFRSLDKNRDDQMSMNEFLGGFQSPGKPLSEAREQTLRGQFQRMDANGDTNLTKEEFVDFYSRSASAPKAPVATKTPVTAKAPVDADEQDVVDPNLARGIELHPWTENQRRSVENILLPAPATIDKGHFHWRIVHVAREAYYEEPVSNMVGLDDSVKIALQLGYGISDNLDVNLIRTNGRTLQVGTSGDPVQMDYYDLLFKYRLMNQAQGSLLDLAVVAGGTVMARNQTSSDLALDAMVVAERNFFSDRLRLGVGLAYTGLSSYEPIAKIGPGAKLLPDEYDAAVAQGNAPAERPSDSTTSVSLTVKFAITERWQAIGETIIPTGGWSTGAGPAAVAGFTYNTNTHEYSFFVSNTANCSFNNVLTGGATHITNLPVFGFAITAHL